MHILLTTYGLLLIFALFCTAQWRSATDMAFMDAIALEVFTKSRNHSIGVLNNLSKEQFDKHSPKKEKSGSKAISNKIDSTTTADTSALINEEDDDDGFMETAEEPSDKEEEKKPAKPTRKDPSQNCSRFLHIGDIFSEENGSILEGRGRDCFTLLKNLLNEMYKGQKFYQNAKDQEPEIDEKFIRNLLERAKEIEQTRKESDEKKWLHSFQDLDQVPLDDDVQNDLRYMVFNGTKSLYDDTRYDPSGYFPLYEITRINKKDKIMSLWLAPRPLLMALFQNEEIVEEVIQARIEILKDLRKMRAQNPDGKEKPIDSDLKKRFGAYIRDINPEYINFEISTTDPKDMPPKKRQKKKSS
ncbi:MAG: hypothetical protein LLF94_06455 [Chlamydiales bacterium]|nr:hypothetical protein [Chlamydiales bacterium]